MKVRMRERDRRALLGLSVAAVVYLLLNFIAFPAFDALQGTSERAGQKEEQLRKYRRALLRKGYYEKLLDQARKGLAEGESRLIRGDNASLASVELQTIVEGAAAKSNIPLQQRNVSAAKKKDDYFNEIAMTLSFESTLNQLSSFLSDLRAAPKFVTVTSVQIAPTQLVDEPPKTGLKKTVKVNVTLRAILASALKSNV